MFGLGTWELVLVLVVAVLFLGPDKLPELAKTLGKSVRSIQRAMGGVNTAVRPMQNAARKLNDSIDRAVDLDGQYEDGEGEVDSSTDSSQSGSPTDDTQDPIDGPVAASDPLGPFAADDDPRKEDGGASSAGTEPEPTNEHAQDDSST